MPLDIQNKRGSLTVVGELNIYTAREAFEKLLPLLQAAKSPALNLARVSEFDSAGLQLLLKANRDVTAAGKELRMSQASTAIREALDLTQCDELRARLGSPS